MSWGRDVLEPSWFGAELTVSRLNDRLIDLSSHLSCLSQWIPKLSLLTSLQLISWICTLHTVSQQMYHLCLPSCSLDSSHLSCLSQWIRKLSLLTSLQLISWICTLHTVSQHLCLPSSSLDKHRLILIIFGKHHQHTFKNDMQIFSLFIFK